MTVTQLNEHQMKEFVEKLANISKQLERIADILEREVQVKRIKEGR
ncbi:MAG: hypothetical protein ACYSSM_05115 [Planctomycetota bacterium]|jgi:hypothetical protein